MIRFIVLTCVACFSCSALSAQEVIARFTVEAGEYDRKDIPLSVDLDAITFEHDSLLRLEEIRGTERTGVPFQIAERGSRRLCWILDGSTPAGDGRVFELVKGEPAEAEGLSSRMEDGGLVLGLSGKELLRYNYKTVYPPEGVDTVFRRSGFIHPLRTPSGKVLTRIQPPDHYHHVGIWNPWTKVEFEGRDLDFWNLYKQEGTVRFAGFTGKVQGPVYAGFRALHEHVVLREKTEDEVALHEVWDVRTYPVSDGMYICDFTSSLNCAGESPFTIKEYRYAGFGFRATEQWTNRNSSVLTSEGKTRKDADGSTAKWCIVSGETDGSETGILFMSYPANYNFPEPLRIWPEDANGGRGDMFFNFAPTKTTDWHLEPGKTYTLRYRMLVFDGSLDASAAENAWQSFANPPGITIETR